MAGIEHALAALAAQRGHGVYRPPGSGELYRPDEVAIVVDDVIDAPDRLVVVRAYDAGTEPDSRNPWTEPRHQWRFRGPASGDRDDSAQRAQALLDDLHGLGPIELPDGTTVMSIFSLNHEPLPLGRDPAGRYEHTVNTRTEYVHPTAHRPA